MRLHDLRGALPRSDRIGHGLLDFLVRGASLTHRFHVLVRAGLAAGGDRDGNGSQFLCSCVNSHCDLHYRLCVSEVPTGDYHTTGMHTLTCLRPLAQYSAVW